MTHEKPLMCKCVYIWKTNKKAKNKLFLRIIQFIVLLIIITYSNRKNKAFPKILRSDLKNIRNCVKHLNVIFISFLMFSHLFYFASFFVCNTNGRGSLWMYNLLCLLSSCLQIVMIRFNWMKIFAIITIKTEKFMKSRLSN